MTLQTRKTIFTSVAEYWKEIARLRRGSGDIDGALKAEEQAAKTLVGIDQLKGIEHLTDIVMAHEPKRFEHLCQLMNKR